MQSILFADIDLANTAASAERNRKYATNPAYRAVTIKVDMTNPQSVQEMTDFVVKQFGQIYYCVNCAGVSADSFLNQ